MRARKYIKRIEFWQATSAADGFGGNPVTTEELITSSWASVETVGSNSRYVSRATDLGITDPNTAILVRTRFRRDIDYNAINQFIKYRGVSYIIQSAPTNANFFDSEIEFIAVRQKTDSVSNITPI